MANKLKTGIIAGLFSLGSAGLTSCVPPSQSNSSDKSGNDTTEIVKHTPNDLLLKAAVEGNIDKLKDALSQGADPNFKNEQGQSVIMYSLEQNSSLLHQGKSLVVAEYMLDNTQVDLSLKDANNKILSDYIKEYTDKLQMLAASCAAPRALGIKVSAEKAGTEWQKVLEKVQNQEKKDSQVNNVVNYRLLQKHQR